MPLSVGARLGPYEILSALGAGGMGEVYRARDPRLGRDVAIKVLPDDFASDPDRLRRFEQEARASGALNHPNVLVVLDVGTHENTPYLVSELLEGESLRERLRQGAIPLRKAIEYGVQIAQGLAAAHEKGIVHRDIKPENLVLTKSGVKILDFGLAKLRRPREEQEEGDGTATQSTATGAVVGTASYMSPEQVRGLSADHRSDIFSLGIVLYEILSRERPFKGQTSAETMTAILRQDAPELSGIDGLSPSLDRIVRRCLEKNPEDRFHSAHDLGLALEALAGQNEPRSIAHPSPRRRAWNATLPVVAFGVGILAYQLGRQGVHTPQPVFHQLTFRRQAIDTARFTADGASVIYGATREDNQPGDIYSQSVDGVDARPLGIHVELKAVGSADLAVEQSKDNEDSTLSRVPLEGGGLRKVIDGVEWADFSPDGALAVARAVNGREWIEFPVGNKVWESNIGGVSELRVSPDGEGVAFMEQVTPTDSAFSVSVVDKKGRKATLSSGWRAAWGTIAWSPDSREVWFAAGRNDSPTSLHADLHAVSLAGKERLVLPTAAELRLLDISRSGRVLLAATETTRELRGAPDGTHERSFAWHDGTALGDLSTDGKNLLFSEGGVAAGARYAALYLRPLGGSTVARLGDGFGLSQSPDGVWALAYDDASGGMGQLSLVPTGAGQTKLLARGSLQQIEAACWFPDGRRIVVVGNEPGQPRRLFVQDVPDGRPRGFSPDGLHFPKLATNMVSPDGRLVAAMKLGELSWKYAFYPTAGGAAIPIPGLAQNEEPIRWSADGRFLYTWGGWFSMPARIARIDLQTGRKQAWKELRPPDTLGVSGIFKVWLAPDGGAYFYDYVRHLSRLYVVDGLR